MKKTTLLIFVFTLIVATIGCGSGGGTPTDPNKGFLVIGQAQVYNIAQQTSLIYPTGGRYQGQFLSGAGTYGSVDNFDVLESFSTYNVHAAKLPGTWRISLSGSIFTVGSLCRGAGTKDVNVNLGSQETVICPGGNVAFLAQPESVDAFNPPSTVKIMGSGISDAYGMPTVAIYNEFGNVVASVSAAQTLADDGSVRPNQAVSEIAGIQFNGTNLSQVYDGTYSITINNLNADGSWSIVGGAVVAVYGNPPPVWEPDPGGGDDCPEQPRDQPQLECQPQSY